MQQAEKQLLGYFSTEDLHNNFKPMDLKQSHCLN